MMHASALAGDRGIGRSALVTRLVLATMIAIVALWPAAYGTAQDEEEPAQPEPQTIAHGVDLMPEVPVAWRVLDSSAVAREEAPFASRTLGFVLGNEGDVLLTDEVSGEQKVVAPGEAAFHREGVSQQRASIEPDGTHTDATSDYYAIELIVADAAEDESTIGDSELILATDEFSAPEGHRELSLQRTVLEAGATIQVEAGEATGLMVVTDGDLEATAGDDTRSFGVDGAAGFTGSLDIEAGDEGATLVVASIGREVEPPPTPEPTEEAVETGTLVVTLYDCPEGTNPQEDATACEEATEAAGVEVADIDAPDETIAGEGDGGTFTFAELPAATYALLGLRAEDDERIVYAAPPAEAGQENYLVTVEAGEEVAVDVFRYPDPANETGTLVFSIFDCPEGVDPTQDATDECAPGADDFGASVLITDEGVDPDSDEYLLSGAERDGDAYVLSGLPAATYLLLGFGPINADVAVYVTPPAEAGQDGYLVELPPGGTVELEVYRYTPEGGGAETGTLSMTVFDCPAGVDATEDASACTPGDDPYLFYVYDLTTQTIIALTEDAEREGDAYLFTLEPGTYGIASDNLPDNALVAVGGDAFQTQDGPQVTIVAGETSEADVFVYILE